MNQLSIFIDESGDFGEYSSHSPYYLVTMVFHDQSIDLSPSVLVLDQTIFQMGYSAHALHVGPLIRREPPYLNDTMQQRKKLLNALVFFTRSVNIQYHTFIVEKRMCSNIIDLTASLASQISAFFNEHLEYFLSFDKILVYYDNGQIELTRILSAIFPVIFSNLELRKVRPSEYKLFQTADMLCTLELVNLKFEAGQASNSEQEFFHSYREFKKNYLKALRKRML